MNMDQGIASLFHLKAEEVVTELNQHQQGWKVNPGNFGETITCEIMCLQHNPAVLKALNQFLQEKSFSLNAISMRTKTKTRSLKNFAHHSFLSQLGPGNIKNIFFIETSDFLGLHVQGS